MTEYTKIDWTLPIVSAGDRKARYLGMLNGNKEPYVCAVEMKPGVNIELCMNFDEYGCMDIGGNAQLIIRNEKDRPNE